MPIYKGAVEVTSGNLHKGSTEIQEGYKASDAFYVNSTVISFIDYPGITPNPKTFSGSPGDTISPAATVSWSVSAPSGQAYQSTPTISGVSSPFVSSVSSNGSGFGSTNSTVATFSVNKPGTYPSSAISSDYGNVTTSTPTSTVNSVSVSVAQANINGGGGSSFGSTATGSISGGAYTANGAGGSGMSCGAGRYAFNNWSVSGGPSGSGAGNSVSFTLNAPGSYSATVSPVYTEAWAAWLTFTQDNTLSGCPSTGYTCYSSSATWTGSGGGNLNWNLGGVYPSACFVFSSYNVACNNASADPKSLITYFSNTGGYGGACNVTYTL
tara:strand:- start:73 stop:1047 length:975 start_codon:yes stop_codon:yes gene_type:complete